MTIKHIHISPSWVFEDDHGHRVDPQLFKLLAAVHDEHKLTEAAKRLGVSYRHCWNLLNKWTEFFGDDLVALSRGKGAKLTPLGEKLLWVERRAAAKFEPQMDNLASTLNIDIHRLLDQNSPVLHIHASHGFAVALLPKLCADIELNLQYMSPIDALKSLNQGHCNIAGFHLPSNVKVTALLDNYPRYIDPTKHRVIRFIARRMGLHVKAGNPLNITQLSDLQRPDIRFINRNIDSGSRALLDDLLHNDTIHTNNINGYHLEEYTHSAVAAYIAAGMADTGFGVEAAARKFDLDFIPIADENYWFVCLKRELELPTVQLFLVRIRSQALVDAVEPLAGYSAEACGEITTPTAIFTL